MSVHQRIAEFAASAREVSAFFFFLGRRGGKARVFALLGLIPVVLAVVVRIVMHGRSEDVAAVFTEILMVFFLQFYIVILSLFFGTSIVAEEIEGRTLPYLVSRPLTKPGIIAGKYGAYVLLMVLMVTVNLALSYFVMNSDRLGAVSLYVTFLRYAGVLALGVLAYTAFFTFLGAVLKKAILVGLVFGFGWENVIQYFPGSTQKFSLVHYLKSLLPYRPMRGGGGYLTMLLFRLEPTGPAVSVLTLAAVTAVFLALAGAIFRAKEYLFEE